MTALIPSLAKAHRAIITTLAANGEVPHLAATARKIEATILTETKALPEGKIAEIAGHLMNSGSLKALKLVPKGIKFPAWGHYEGRPDADFIVSQPATYMKEAKKRGFVVSEDTRMTALRGLTEATSNHGRLALEAVVLDGPVGPNMVTRIIPFVFEISTEAAARTAPQLAKLLKSGAKDNGDCLHRELEHLFCIHQPAAAHEHLFKIIGLFSLLGIKAPSKDAIENDQMEALAKSLFGREGRKAFREETGGLEAYIAGGHLQPVPIIRELEKQRSRFHLPQPATSRQRRYY